MSHGPVPDLPPLHLPPALSRQLWAQARAEAPRECVGILGGPAGPAWRATVYQPLPNVADRPGTEYQADPLALLQTLRRWREDRLVLRGIVHSHPRGPGGPSATDTALAAYDVPYLIADLRGGTLRAFALPAGTEWPLQPPAGQPR